MQNTFSQSGNGSKWFSTKIIFQNRYVALETPPRPPPLHGKCHLKFPFWFFESVPNPHFRQKVQVGQTARLRKFSGWQSGWLKWREDQEERVVENNLYIPLSLFSLHVGIIQDSQFCAKITSKYFAWMRKRKRVFFIFCSTCQKIVLGGYEHTCLV